MKYFVIDTQNGKVTKTDDDSIAKDYADSEWHIVIDKETEAVLYQEQVKAIDVVK